MAKENAEAKSDQIKVLIRPTAIGLLVLKRLARPFIDKSAELRRLIELGFAAEQAGFILDGMILRNGGRNWDTQPLDDHGQGESADRSISDREEQTEPVAKPSDKVVDKQSISQASDHSDQVVYDQVKDASFASSLRSNLRGLSS